MGRVGRERYGKKETEEERDTRRERWRETEGIGREESGMGGRETSMREGRVQEGVDEREREE